MSRESGASNRVPNPRGNYSLLCVDDNTVVTSALGPSDPNQPTGFSHIGRIGDDLDAAQGRSAAIQAAKTLLAVLEDHLGSLDTIARVVALRGYLVTTDDFADHASVMNGASETIIAALGNRGQHPRTTVGVFSLPFGVPIVVELTARLRVGASG